MIRGFAGSGFGVSIKDLQSRDVQIEHYTNQKTYQTITEYWIYRTKKTKTKLFNALGKQIYKTEDRPRLFCIITCDNDNLLVNREKGLAFIQGVRFTGKDINEYLRKTGRSGVDNIMSDPHEKDIHEPDEKLKRKSTDDMKNKIDDWAENADN